MKFKTWTEVVRDSCKKAKKLGDEYFDRLSHEHKEIIKQGANEYWMELLESDKVYDHNDNGLVLPFLYGKTEIDPIANNIRANISYQADFPDIDTDFLPYARDEIKRYSSESYGSDKVCTVGNWNTFKLKQALQDACRVLEGDMNQVIRLTKTLNDDEYDSMDTEDLCKACQEFNDYYIINKEIVDLALELRGRIKSQGQHAGGIIISSVPLADTIPMSYIKGKYVSQWTEGMAATQLSPFGLVKFDILGLKTMAYNVYTEELIKKSRKISLDWDECDPSCDEPYAGFQIMSNGEKLPILFNDEDAIKMADEIRTEAVFQFDTHVAKGVLSNGVRNFHDLVAYTALARPGPMEMIPEYVARRDDPKQLWKKKEDPRVVSMLEDTHGIICFHEDTMISMSDGSHKKIKHISIGDSVSCVDIDNNKTTNSIVTESKPTVLECGLKITTKNGKELTVTKDHNVLTDSGYVKARNLKIGQLVAVPIKLDDDNNEIDICKWLGENDEVAYFLGLITGDGCLRSTSYSVAVGNDKDIADILDEWINTNLNVSTVLYWHCRSYYIRFKNEEITESIIDLPKYVDSKKWYENAYLKYGGSDIAKFINKSIWFVYNKLRSYNIIITKKSKKSRKTKLHNFVELMGLNVKHVKKTIPNIIMTNCNHIKYRYLSGLIESDGCLKVSASGMQICYISSGSKTLLDDINRMCMSLGILTTTYQTKVYLYNTALLNEMLSGYLLYKRFNGKLSNGDNTTYVNRDIFLDKISTSMRQASKDTGISRTTLRKNNRLFRYSTAIKSGYNSGDIRYIPIKEIKETENTQFHNISVPPHHNIIANGIVAKQCYQEQLTQFWTKFGGLTVPEAEKARKAVAKKKKEDVLKLLPRIVEGMIKNGFPDDPAPINDDGIYVDAKPHSAQGWANKMVTFGRYAFNRSHAYAYGVIAYRALWLKAHFPSEYWASILTYCHPDKVAKFVGVAKLEGVNFKPVRTGFLGDKLAVDDDLNVYPSLTMIKGIGDAVAEALSVNGGKCTDIDDFVSIYGKRKSPMERLIKLGAFEDLHPGKRKHLWFWYQYKYASKNDEATKIRHIYNETFMEENWPEEKLKKERERQIKEYKDRYPKKKKVPIKVMRWLPKIGPKHDRPNLKEFIDFFDRLWSTKDDYDKSEAHYYKDWGDRNHLEFEREYLGVYWTSPLRLYKHNPDNTFCNVKDGNQYCRPVDAVVEKYTKGTTKNGTSFVNLFVNDGIETQIVRIWGDSWSNQDTEILKEGNGIRLSCEWNDKFQNFNLARNNSISSLARV